MRVSVFAIVVVVMVIGGPGRSEGKARVAMRTAMMMFMGPQTVPVFQRSVHRARLP